MAGRLVTAAQSFQTKNGRESWRILPSPVRAKLPLEDIDPVVVDVRR
jgi:hypothetical protein